MDAVLSAATSATGRFSRFAFCSSRKVMRGVAMRPGNTMLAVTPSRPTSRASVFDQPTSDSRSALDEPGLGTGATTTDEGEVTMGPQPPARQPGVPRDQTNAR